MHGDGCVPSQQKKSSNFLKLYVQSENLNYKNVLASFNLCQVFRSRVVFVITSISGFLQRTVRLTGCCTGILLPFPQSFWYIFYGFV